MAERGLFLRGLRLVVSYVRTHPAPFLIAVAGSPNKVQLSRTPTVTIKPRDTATGTLYAFFDDAAAIVRPWLLTGVSASGPYVELTGANYNAAVYTDDTATVPARPLLPGTPET